MTIRFECFLHGKKITELMTASNKIYITADENSISFVEDENNEKKIKEIGIINKRKNMYILENQKSLIYVNGIKAELVQLETGDIMEFLNFQIKLSIYMFEVKKAFIEAEYEGGVRKTYLINSPVVFIGNPQKADIPAFEKNPFLPISDYSAAIVIRENSYELFPINTSVIKFRMREPKISIPLENGSSFDVGKSRFVFKISN
ncbi:MAG: hypothetical protein ACP5IO_00350 [Elusimicrobiales bacterium]